MTQDTPPTHDHSSIGTGGRTLSESVRADHRRLVSSGNETATVPGDYTTVQEAVSDVPLQPGGAYKIEIEPGDYSDEHVYVPPVVGNHPPAQYGEASGSPPLGRLVIDSTTDTASDVTLGSVTVAFAGSYQDVVVRNVTVTAASPYLDEGAALGAFGGTGTRFSNIEVGPQPGKVGIAYGGDVEFSDITPDGQSIGIEVKGPASYAAVNGTWGGSLDTRLAKLTQYGTLAVNADLSQLSCPQYYRLGGGDQGLLYTNEGIPLRPPVGAGNFSLQMLPGKFDEHPSFSWGSSWSFPDQSPGAMWYVTGGGTPAEGLYIQQSGGITKVV